MTKEKIITVVAAASVDAFEAQGYAVLYGNCETIAAAKKRAQYMLTEEYRIASEASTRLGYAQVLVNGEVHSHIFPKPVLTARQREVLTHVNHFSVVSTDGDGSVLEALEAKGLVIRCHNAAPSGTYYTWVPSAKGKSLLATLAAGVAK